MRDLLKEHVERSLRALGQEREQVRLELQTRGSKPSQWAELEHRACIAELVARKVTPSSARTVDGALAAVRAFREAHALRGAASTNAS